MEQGQLYEISSNTARILFPEVLKMLVLGAVFIALLVLNLKLANIILPFFLYPVLAVLILALIGLQGFLTLRKAKRTYKFFQAGIIVEGKSSRQWFAFANIPTGQSAEVKKGAFDKMLGTGTIVMHNLTIANVEIPDQVANYINQLLHYSRQYQRGGY